MEPVARQVRALQNDDESAPTEQPLSDFRQTAAWVLLGEPGAGKSEALKMEAKATGGQYVTVANFINSHPIPPSWHGKTLFIDAMDEARASGSTSLALQIANQLRQLDQPAFRLSCRAADWLGSMDKADLQDLSPDGKLLSLQLSPLTDNDIREILRLNHQVADPDAFIEKAERHGIKPLLNNPQTLGLIAKAVREDQWPDNREQVYQLACEQLAHENNRRHRDQQRNTPADDQVIMQAAGQLFATLLLAGKSGIALDEEVSNDEFPTLQQLSPEDATTTVQALQSALFVSSGQHDEQVIPCHRSVAEYLAAKWLANRLDKCLLPLGRLLNLLLGYDGGVVADLRGLFAWLAQSSVTARHRLIAIDPLGIVLYGDASPFSPADKRLLLQALRKRAEDFPGFRWHLHHDQEAFGALADPTLSEDFRVILKSKERDEATQSHMDCVLDILQYGAAIPELAETLLSIVKDKSLWPRLRSGALKTWIKFCSTADAKKLLADIHSNRVEDADDDLLGRLLIHLYPNQLEVEELLQHLHPPKESRLTGYYRLFWKYELHNSAPDHHLKALLCGLANHADVQEDDYGDGEESIDLTPLIAKALVRWGETASDAEVFTWLGLGQKTTAYAFRDDDSPSQIRSWLSKHPDRYKAVLAICVAQEVSQPLYSSRFYDSEPPEDLGLWHLNTASSMNEATSRLHLLYSVEALLFQRGSRGLSLEVFADWMQQNPARASWLEKHLYWEIPEWRLKSAARKIQRQQEAKEKKHTRAVEAAPHIPTIASGRVPANVLDHLSGIWLNHFSDIHGETISERFANYSDLGDRLMQAAESGFKLSLLRDDLPSADEIIALYLKKQRYWISQACLLGLQLLWEEEPAQVLALSDDLTERLLAFRISTSHLALQEWLAHTAQQRPELFASLLVRYATAALKQGDTSLEMVYLISQSEAFDQVAALAAPNILSNFPLRAKKEQLGTLEQLLEVVHAKAPDQLKPLIEHKLSLKGMDSAQKTLWYGIALLLDPIRYEKALWRHIGSSSTRAALATDYLCEKRIGRIRSSKIPEYTLGRLIELITPDADFEYASGIVTAAMQRGDQVRSMIDMLGSSATPEAEKILQQLQEQPALQKLRYKIQDTLHQQQSKRREEQFRFSTVESVAHVLANNAPTDSSDLAALCLGYLDEIAHEIREANDDGFRTFWNVAKGKPTGPREENLCRDDIYRILRTSLSTHGVSSAPEADHAGDKRADLCLDYRNQFTLPIEIKRDSHRDLWKALRAQLIGQYVNAPKSQGYGIYLVLWFNDAKHPMPATLDGGKKPKSPSELQTRLTALLNEEERQRIFVRVLDVSWPK